MRIPSEGQEFELAEMKMQVTKTIGRIIKAKGQTKQFKMINRNDTFVIFGTKFSVTGFKYHGSNGKISLEAIAI